MAPQEYAPALQLATYVQAYHPPDFLVLNAGNTKLSFQPKEALGLSQESVGGIELGFDVLDVSSTAACFQQQGGRLEGSNKMGWGESVYGRDLDGHRVTICRSVGRLRG